MKTLALIITFMLGYGHLFGQDLTKASEEAYIYGYPLVIMNATRETITSSQAPVNHFYNLKEFPESDYEIVVSPNVDTLYSTAWLDVSKEPVILSIPEIKDRYYIFEFLDAWTNVIGSISPRTVKTSEGNYAISGPQWKGDLPNGIESLKSPTNCVWLIGRIKTDGIKEYEIVNKLQDQLKLTPLNYWGKNYKARSDLNLKTNNEYAESPSKVVNEMDAVTFFSNLSQLLKQNPPSTNDKDAVENLAHIGIIPGKDFQTKSLTKAQLEELTLGIKRARDKIKAEWKDPKGSKVNGWKIFRKEVGDFGTNYLLRAIIAYGAIGANLPADAIYPTTRVDEDNLPLNGSYPYLIHFNKGEMPPVDGFWSLTMYNDLQFFVPNLLHRYGLSSTDPIQYNKDGSLDLYIQVKSPGKEKESNWLPAPNSDFNLILRLYEPKEGALDGTWNPPPVRRDH